MQRRTLLKYSLFGSTLSLKSFATAVQRDELDESVPFGLEDISVADLQHFMSKGSLSAAGLTRLFLRRIKKIDRQGPRINTVIEINPDALKVAKALDRERRKSGPRSAMHGIPVLIKDNIDTGDRMQTTAGSLALFGPPAPRDSFLVERLRSAGAIILGKTNLSEWANFRSTRSSSGWSSRGGQTKNPYVLARNPCGSSSGSGAAVAANLCAAAIGTETNGSIICPSSANGIVGIKPTVGLVSRSGIIPISHSQDTAGPMGRSLADAAALLNIMTGIDPEDSATEASSGKVPEDYTKFLDENGLQGARIGVARNYFGFDERVDAIMESSIETMRQLGAIIVDDANIETAGDFGNDSFEVLLYEFKADLNAYLNRRGNTALHNLEEIIAFNDKNKDKVMPFFGQELLLASQEKGPLTDPQYLAALERSHLLAGEKGIDATLAKHNVDAIVAPSGGPAWVTDLVNGDNFSGGSSSAAAVSRYPNITVPAGGIHGLPVGISFFSTAFTEPQLIKFAYAFEQGSKVRQPPKFLPTIEGRSAVDVNV